MRQINRRAPPVFSASLSRRQILLGAGAMATLGCTGTAIAAPSSCFFDEMRPLGVQLYSVGIEAQKDLDATLLSLARIGFRTVENAGFAGRSPQAFRAALDRAGLSCTSAHIPARALRQGPGPTLRDDPASIAEIAATVGFDTVILPLFVIPDRFSVVPTGGESIRAMLQRIATSMTIDDWRATATFLNESGASLARYGLKLGYHNHSHEFSPVGGTVPFDLLLEETDPDFVTFELDAGWVATTGRDPGDLLRRHPNRFRAMHIKDLIRDTDSDAYISAEIGRGKIDWNGLLPVAAANGVTHYFVEHEAPYLRPVLESLQASSDFLRDIRR